MGTILLGIVSALCAEAITAASPNFSGDWRMDYTRSESAASGEMTGPVSLQIAQDGSNLKIATTRFGHPETIAYTIEAGAVHVGSPGAPDRGSSPNKAGQTHRAYWEGPRLVTLSTGLIHGESVTIKQIYELDAPAEMHVEATVALEHGYTGSDPKPTWTWRDVYVRQSP